MRFDLWLKVGASAQWPYHASGPQGTSFSASHREEEEETDFQSKLKDDNLITLLFIHLSIYTNREKPLNTH